MAAPPGGPSRGFGWEPGTMRKAAVVGGALLALLGLGTWAVHEPAAKGPLASYARLGVPAGAEVMQRDLLAGFPPGTSVQPLVQRLEGQGLRCGPPAEGAMGSLHCTARLQAWEHQQLHVLVVLWATNDRLMSLSVGFSMLDVAR
jgi:hypothetical protein